MSTGGKTQLYRHFDANKKLLYVGISLSTIHRLGQHKTDSHWYDLIANVTIETFETREAAVIAERNAISNENPIHNLARPAIKVERLSFRGRRMASARDITRRIVQFNTTYSIKDVAEALGSSPAEITKFMDENKLGFIEVPWRIGASFRRRVTGWQLIDFIEFLESETMGKKR